MPTPAAARLAAAGLGLTVTGARATVTFQHQHQHDSRASGLPAVADAFAAVGRLLTGAVRVVVLRGDVWSLPTPAGPEAAQSESPPFEAAQVEAARFDLARFEAAESPLSQSDPAHQSRDEDTALERRIEAWQAAFGWLSDRADLISIAALDGPAGGAGLQLALLCDLRVVTTDTTLALPEAVRGLVPGLGATHALVRLLGYATALDLCLTGRRLTAAEALAAGVAQRVVPAADLGRAVDELVAAVLAAPRTAATETKALLRGAGARGRDGQRAAERAALARCLADPPAG